MHEIKIYEALYSKTQYVQRELYCTAFNAAFYLGVKTFA